MVPLNKKPGESDIFSLAQTESNVDAIQVSRVREFQSEMQLLKKPYPWLPPTSLLKAEAQRAGFLRQNLTGEA